MYKTNYEVIDPKQEHVVMEDGNALGVQSILHLRGNHPYVCQTPGSYFLFNGEIW